MRTFSARASVEAEGQAADATPAETSLPGKGASSAETALAAAEERAREATELLLAAESRAHEMEDRWLRAAAEFENVRKRSVREAAAASARAGDSALLAVIRVVDDLERAVEAGGADGVTTAAILEGLDLVLDHARAALAEQRVEAIDPLGEPFDPAHHEAVLRNPAGEANRVTRVLASGYRRDGRLLRAAQVEVGG